jgi:hypothetical protein
MKDKAGAGQIEAAQFMTKWGRGAAAANESLKIDAMLII